MRARIAAALLMMAMSVCLLSDRAGGALRDKVRESIEPVRMEDVRFDESAFSVPRIGAVSHIQELGTVAEAEAAEERPAKAVAAPAASVEPVIIDSRADEVKTTTLSGGVSIKNETPYSVRAESFSEMGPGLTLKADTPQILILHTHSSEAYTPAGLDRYEASDSFRTEDTEFNIVRVGDELTALLEAEGLHVLHDRSIYDYPSYTGSYTRSGEAVEEYLRQYPDISIVLDIHRDALGSGDVVYKTMAEESGTCASQIMLLVGTDASGLEHPHWRRNLALALYLQSAVSEKYPTLMRPVDLVEQRYNQHLTTGSLIVEIGSSGNTLQEALAATRLFAKAAAPALSALVEGRGE